MKKQIRCGFWNPWFLDWQEADLRNCDFCQKTIYSGWLKTKTWRKSQWSDNGKSVFSCWACMYKKLEKKKRLFIENLDGEIAQIEEWKVVALFQEEPRKKKKKARVLH